MPDKDPLDLSKEESMESNMNVEKTSSRRPTTTTAEGLQETDEDFEWMDSWYRFWKLMHNYLH